MHVESICNKVETRLYSLKQLKHAKTGPNDGYVVVLHDVH